MKWAMIIALGGILILVLTNEKLRARISSIGAPRQTITDEAVQTPAPSGGSRLGEADAVSEMSTNASR